VRLSQRRGAHRTVVAKCTVFSGLRKSVHNRAQHRQRPHRARFHPQACGQVWCPSGQVSLPSQPRRGVRRSPAVQSGHRGAQPAGAWREPAVEPAGQRTRWV